VVLAVLGVGEGGFWLLAVGHWPLAD